MKTGLVKKQIVDKRGKRTSVWVKVGDKINSSEPRITKKYFANLSEKLYSKIKRRDRGEGAEISLTKAEVSDVLNNGMVGFISAGVNPSDPNDVKLTPKQVSQREDKLKADLIDLGFVFERVKGKYGEEEDSFMVLINDIRSKDIEKLGTKYNQDSVIHSIGNKNKMIFTTGNNKGKRIEGNGFQKLDDQASDFYSEVTTPKGKMKFSLNFDFDKLVKAFIKWYKA